MRDLLIPVTILKIENDEVKPSHVIIVNLSKVTTIQPYREHHCLFSMEGDTQFHVFDSFVDILRKIE